MKFLALKLFVEHLQTISMSSWYKHVHEFIKENNIDLPANVTIKDLMNASSQAFTELNLHTLSIRLIEGDARNLTDQKIIKELHARLITLINETINTNPNSTVTIDSLWQAYLYIFPELARKHLDKKFDEGTSLTNIKNMHYRMQLKKVFETIARKPFHDILYTEQTHDKRMNLFRNMFEDLSLHEIYTSAVPRDSFIFASIKCTPLLQEFPIGLVAYSTQQSCLNSQDINSIQEQCSINNDDVKLANIVAHELLTKIDVKTMLKEGVVYPVSISSSNKVSFIQFKQNLIYVMHNKGKLTVIIGEFSKVKSQCNSYTKKLPSFIAKNNLTGQLAQEYLEEAIDLNSDALRSLVHSALCIDLFDVFKMKLSNKAIAITADIDPNYFT